ncbi:PTS sugar transporter subunit IIA [Staphylococcus equorum]|uniref:PTS sugar transporter subunit IIA n=1 Tax=Staphylococcus equorum TaxID=246432 RepID=UPI003D806529
MDYCHSYWSFGFRTIDVSGTKKTYTQKQKKSNENTIDEEQVGQTQEDIIKPEQVFLNKNIETKEEILKYIANKAVQLEISNESEKVLEGLKKREEESSTGMENGIAIPHVASGHIFSAKLIIVQLNNGIEWPSLDNQNTDFIISILVPKNNEGKHLKILSQLSRKLIDENYIKELKNAKSEVKISELIQGGIS